MWNLKFMKTSDVVLLILAIGIVLGMLLTALFGRGSRHGYGNATPPQKTIVKVKN
jgi:hypothetical protein